jgi:glycogen debranching enzyme
MTKRSSDNRDLDAHEIDALMAAQRTPASLEQTEALEKAARLQRAADTYKHIFSNELRRPD